MKEETKKLKKPLAAAVSAALIAAVVIGGSFAYLQGTSDDVENTFSTNKVNVLLEETTGGKYNIVPGTSQTKDPKVIVNATVNSYVYVEVNDETQNLVTWEIADGWTELDGFDNVYYCEFVPTEENGNTATYDVLKGNKVSYSASLTNADMLDKDSNLKADIKLTFEASAIQKAPFNDPVMAYKMENATVVTEATGLSTALSSGGAVVMDSDVAVAPAEGEDDLVPQMSVTTDTILNIGSQTLSVDSSVYAEELSYTPALIEVTDGATLMIDGNGTITAEAGNNNSYGINVNKGTLIINGGNYYGALTAIQVQEGSAVINGGFFDLAPTCKAAVPYYAKYVVNAIDRYYQDGTATIEIRGGTFVNFDPSDNPEGEGTSYVAEGYRVESVTQTNGDTWYTVVPDAD